MAPPNSPTGVLLVGSIPLSSTEEVFTSVSAALPGRLKWIPDGETGIRTNFNRWQVSCFPRETLRDHLGGVDFPADHAGFTQESVKPTQYDIEAIQSYEKFLQLRKKNIIPANVRFQVSFPTPHNCIQRFIRPEFQEELEPFYEKRIHEALVNILEKIPAEDLALQLDMPSEVLNLECERGYLTDPICEPRFSPVMSAVVDRVERITTVIPNHIPLGIHLCYGDIGHKHFVEPEDTTTMVNLSNSIIKRLAHPISWIHLPVPKNRDDTAYFEPLKTLNIGPDCELFLGLVHANDEDGTKRRIQTAQSVLTHSFGVATECGLGRTPQNEIESILKISRDVTVPYE
jgi:hypothetical protein